MLSTSKVNKPIVEFGDYQTPASFAKIVCEKLSSFYGLQPNVVIEPTFGIGNFLDGVVSTFPNVRKLYGIEINKSYYSSALSRISQTYSERFDTEFFNADIFSFDFSYIKKVLTSKDELLVIGNPPWVTNSQLTSLGSSNLPQKSNYKGYSGLDAMTGKANFDIAEYILLLLLNEFSNSNCVLAMLCKTIVAKNIVRDINKYNISMSSIDLFTFNANDIFGVSCDAGLLVMKSGNAEAKTCSVYDFYTNNKIREFGWNDNKFYADIPNVNRHKSIDGICQLEWRQGIKHDCARVMELEKDDSGIFKNKIGDELNFQLGQFVFPLVKSSDIKSYEITSTRKYVIVPQKRINEDTSQIKNLDSVVWDYLQKNDTSLSARRSSIYSNAPKYSIFGVGDYSFSKYKVGISGFYKEPIFTLIRSEIPIMMDDTCYFLSFENEIDAAITLALLNSSECIMFLKSTAFLDSKRPYTKEVLQRIDLGKLSYLLDYSYINNFSTRLISNLRITEQDYYNYRSLFQDAQLSIDMF